MKKWSIVSLLTLIVFAVTAFFAPPAVGALDEQGLSITKTADKTAAFLGDTITYTYTITNSDNVTISDLSLVDDKLSTISLPVSSIEPGATVNATAQHMVVIADYIPGLVLENVGTITGTRPDSSIVSAEAKASVDLIPYAASLSLEKVADPASADLGDTITYTFTITNTGNVTVSDLSLVDDKLSTISLPATTIDPDATVTATATYEVLLADFAAGDSIDNTATVTGTGPDSSTVSAEAKASVSLLPYTVALSLDKKASLASADLGDTITYTFTITNTGNVTVSDLSLVDDKLSTISLPATTIDPGATVTATATYEVQLADFAAGDSIDNTATVTGTGADGNPVSAEAQASVSLLPYTVALSLDKKASSATASLGDTITYTYTITNTGNVTISDLSLIDDKLSTISLPATTIDPGATVTATATYEVLLADFAAGDSIDNTATVTGTGADGNPVSAEAQASVSLDAYAASLMLEKTADPASASPHETITYTFTITNDGDVTISDLSLVDSNLGAITLSVSSLSPGESTIATYDYEITVDDLPGPIINTATVTGTDPLDNEVSYTTDPVSVSLTINKRIMTRAEIHVMSGVPGKGLENAPGQQKQFNERSRAAERAGKKIDDGDDNTNNSNNKENKRNNGKNGK